MVDYDYTNYNISMMVKTHIKKNISDVEEEIALDKNYPLIESLNTSITNSISISFRISVFIESTGRKKILVHTIDELLIVFFIIYLIIL